MFRVCDLRSQHALVEPHIRCYCVEQSDIRGASWWCGGCWWGVGRGVLGRVGGDGHWAVGPVFFLGGQQLFLLNSFHLICDICAGLPKVEKRVFLQSMSPFLVASICLVVLAGFETTQMRLLQPDDELLRCNGRELTIWQLPNVTWEIRSLPTDNKDNKQPVRNQSTAQVFLTCETFSVSLLGPGPFRTR